MKLTRRNFLLGCAGLGVGLAATTTALYGATHTTNTTGLVLHHNVDIPLRHLPLAFDGYRIGFVTDIHLGTALPHRWLKNALLLFKDHPIDMLLLGGDYIWVPDAALSKAMNIVRNPLYDRPPSLSLMATIFNNAAALCTSVPARDGSYSVLGNHDRWTNASACMRAFRRHGIQVLVNESIQIRRGSQALTISGCDDYLTGFPALPHPPTGTSPWICLSHNPDFAAQCIAGHVEQNGRLPDLFLCGHTHGGQIKLPALGAIYHNIEDTRFFEGLQKTGETYVYTSRGIGMSKIPLRLNCPGEVTLIRLHCA